LLRKSSENEFAIPERHKPTLRHVAVVLAQSPPIKSKQQQK